MKIFEFASIRLGSYGSGPNLEIEMPDGATIEEAWQTLVDKDEDAVWRCTDAFVVQWAIHNPSSGFTGWNEIAYKVRMGKD